MEKYGQYRDKGSGIAPFFTIAPPPSNIFLAPYHLFLFFFRIPFFIFACAVWYLIVQWTPPAGVLRKANLWCILGIPGVWWVDIRVDGVRRGSLGKPGGSNPLPGPGTVIASSYTSPLDVLYLACIFDPIFTQSYPGSRKVRHLSIEGALAACFTLPPPPDQAIPLSQLVAQNPDRVIVVFPESTTSNGRGVLRLTPSLLFAAKDTSIYPVSLRYTPADVVTPIPGIIEAARFLWKLCSRQTHCIRVRIGLPLTLGQQDTAAEIASSFQNGGEETDIDGLTPRERRSLDLVADSLCRLGRTKTLGLGVKEKAQFVDAWQGKTTKKRR